MQRYAGVVLAGIIVAVLLAAGSAVAGSRNTTRSDRENVPEVAEKWFYTKVNIFYDNPRRIHSTNYHKGKVLSAGSLVLISFAEGKDIEFQDTKGRRFALTLVKKHAVPGMTLKTYFEQLFSAEDPYRKEGPFEKLTDSERWNIKNGTIEKGMSREAVLAAYGYPPGHETPSLDDDKWTYWVDSRKPMTVFFKDGRIYRIMSEGKLIAE